MTWTALEEIAIQKPTIILPVGSMEQHGPHLPLSTDSIIAEHVAVAVSNKLSSMILFPTIPIGYSLEHIGFPGTISLSAQTFSSMITEIAESVSNSGFRTLAVINGHGGNRGILDTAVTTIKYAHPGLHLYSFTVLDIAREKFKEIRKSPSGMIGHADELETSMMLAIRPDLVDMSKAVAQMPVFPTNVSLETEDLARVTYAWKAREVTKSGIIGSPNFATLETGKTVIDFAIQTISGIIGEKRG
jgi:creatinine amidohydrolase